jgi:hypothetical protein
MKDIETRKKKLEKYFGILTEEEANYLISVINESRKITDEKLMKKLSL